MEEQEDFQQSYVSPFDAIRRRAEDGSEYWSVRDLAKILGYTQYNKFVPVIKKAEEACRHSDQRAEDHFAHTGEMVSFGPGARRRFGSVFLSRYACYLLIQNADPEKPVVSLGQTSFAVQTRCQELVDEEVLAGLNEDQRRLLTCGQLTIRNIQFVEIVSQAGVITAKDFAIFQDHGYVRLYSGLHRMKGIKKQQVLAL